MKEKLVIIKGNLLLLIKRIDGLECSEEINCELFKKLEEINEKLGEVETLIEEMETLLND